MKSDNQSGIDPRIIGAGFCILGIVLVLGVLFQGWPTIAVGLAGAVAFIAGIIFIIKS